MGLPYNPNITPYITLYIRVGRRRCLLLNAPKAFKETLKEKDAGIPGWSLSHFLEL